METEEPSIAVTAGISPEKYDLYLEADSLIADRLGISPGADLLMTTILENEEDPLVLAELYCVRQLNQQQ